MAHSRSERGRLRQTSSSRECASLAGRAFLCTREFQRNFLVHKKEPHLTRHDPSSFIAFWSKNYISPKPLSIAWLMVFIASSSSSPSQTRVISVPHLIPAAITFNTLFATIFFSPQIMVISLLNFIAVWDKTPAGLKCKPDGLTICNL